MARKSPPSRSADRLRAALARHEPPSAHEANAWHRERARLESRAKQAEAQRDAALAHVEQLERERAVRETIQARKPARIAGSPKRLKPSGQIGRAHV